MRAVITLAGEGSRMLPVTKGLRKEMLPLFYKGQGGVPVLAPVAHLVVNSLHAAGADHATMVVGRDAEAILKYFTHDGSLLDRHAHHQDRLVETLALYDLLAQMQFTWVVQSKPAGFGDALLTAAPAIDGEPIPYSSPCPTATGTKRSGSRGSPNPTAASGMLREPPGADPHAGWCGRGRGKPGLYPIR